MIVIYRDKIDSAARREVEEYLRQTGVEYVEFEKGGLSLIRVGKNSHLLDTRTLEAFSGVAGAFRLSPAAPLASGNGKEKKNIGFSVGKHFIGRDELTLIAGPCSIENEESFRDIVRFLKTAGIHIIRAGAYKPRTSPYSFQGLAVKGLTILKKISSEFDMPVVTEILDIRDIDKICDAADMMQVGMRNMRNYPLLKSLGALKKPVLLKRAMDASVDEWLLSAEYILNEGNENVVLCERGIINPTTCKRAVLDLNSAIEARQRSRLPVFADPSHAAADNTKVGGLAKAAVAAGVDGLMIEVHKEPPKALSDGFQALNLEEFRKLIPSLMEIRKIARQDSL